MNAITQAILIVGIMGLILGAGLAYASKIFAVEKDPKILEVREVLPGANCGACGFPGCDGAAEAIVSGKAAPNACPVGGAAVAAKVGAILGVEVDTSIKYVALVKCNGGKEECGKKFDYYGVKDCHEVVIAMGGDKKCSYGCLGYGSCINACQFGAMFINEKGLAEVNPNLCTACGACVKTCPKNVIQLVPYDKTVHVLCNTQDAGKDVTKTCKVGCITCGICVKNCEFDAIKIPEGKNLSVIDYTKCTECGKCVEKCPKKTIVKS